MSGALLASLRFRLFSTSSGVTGRAGLGTIVVWDADIEWGLRELETNAFVPSAPHRTSDRKSRHRR